MPPLVNKELAAFDQLVRNMDARNRLISVTPLLGGVSAHTSLVEFESSRGQQRGQQRGSQKVVVRRHGIVDLNRNPHIAADEFSLLQTLHGHGLPVPAPLYLERSSKLFGAPVLVSKYIEGSTEFQPSNLLTFITQFAAMLARIHAFSGAVHTFPFLPDKSAHWQLRVTKFRDSTLDETPIDEALCDESIGESRIRKAVATHWPPSTTNASVLLHGDFWPGNVLWRNEQIVAVIDWEDAALGDPLVDLANARLELLWFFGAQAQREFTDHYLALRKTDVTALPLWDLCAALKARFNLHKWAEDVGMEARMRRTHRQFVDQALREIATR